MPQLTLEYTSNIIEKDRFAELFAQCHAILAEKLPTDLVNCKSRAVQQQDYYIGDGNPSNAFVSLHIKIMVGRSLGILNEVAEAILHTLQDHFAKSIQQRNMQITLELQELSHSMYFKKTSF